MYRTLETLTSECLDAVLSNEARHLEIGYRLWLYNYLGGNFEADTPDALQVQDYQGFERRAHLRYLTLTKVLPVWKRAAPDDNTPYEAMDMTLDFIRTVKAGQQEKIQSFETRLRERYFYLDEKYFIERYGGASYEIGAGYFVTQLMEDTLDDYNNWKNGFQNTILYDRIGEMPVSFADSESEFGGEVLRLDSYCCEVYGRYFAFLNGESDELQENLDDAITKAKSEEFWRWWLKTAAFTAFHQPLV